MDARETEVKALRGLVFEIRAARWAMDSAAMEADAALVLLNYRVRLLAEAKEMK